MRTCRQKYSPYLMWFLPLTFFAYQFILRLWPGLMMQNIMEQFSIDASHFGMLAAFYYYGYAGMQIPIAILLDHFGARNTICLFATICGLATLVFTYTECFYVALASRFLIGAGSAVGFLGVSKVVSEWFPKEQYARMVGLSFTFGLMGAIYGGKPVHLCIEAYGGQNVAFTLAIISIAIGCGAYWIVRPPQEKAHTTDAPLRLADLSTIFTSPTLWFLAIGNLLMVGSLEGFGDVWGVPYLMQAFGLDKGDAAGLVSFIFFGMLVGGPLLAYIAKHWSNYVVIVASGFGMAIAFAWLFTLDTYHAPLLACLFFIVGILCCYQVIVFAAGSDWVSPQQLGITIAFLNCLNMLGGSFFHTTIGKLMDVFWVGTQSSGIREYDLTTYQYALSVVPICAVIGAIMVGFVGCRIKYQNRT